MGIKAYLQALRDSNSDVSVQVKMAKEYNKPVIIWMTNELSAEDRVNLERFFIGYNVIKVLELNRDDKDSWQAVIKETNRLSEDILRNRVLNKTNFLRIDLDKEHYYYSFKREQVEICLEPCAGGFCVRVFDMDQQLLEPGKCTDCSGYLESVYAMFGERRDDTWLKALEMANELYKRFVVDKIDSEGGMATYII
ncbi:MAG: hypothetical protein C0408_11440 [Odoribacter sp.]|nr:hypothetical protein [Odoribacter sp.]